MTLKEFINKEKELHNLVGFNLELKVKNLQTSTRYTIDLNAHEIFGFLNALHCTDYISSEVWEGLFDDTQKIQNETYRKLWNL